MNRASRPVSGIVTGSPNFAHHLHRANQAKNRNEIIAHRPARRESQTFRTESLDILIRPIDPFQKSNPGHDAQTRLQQADNPLNRIIRSPLGQGSFDLLELAKIPQHRRPAQCKRPPR